MIRLKRKDKAVIIHPAENTAQAVFFCVKICQPAASVSQVDGSFGR